MVTDAIGLSLGGSSGIDDEQMITLARRADELGYDSVWTGEAWGRDVFTVLTMIACHTRKIRLGTGIATVFSRTPALTAQSIASLDVVSKGRAILGLGTSGRAVVEDWHGVEYSQPLDRTREYVEIIRMALSGQRVEYDGRLFRLRRFRLPFSPVQDNIPIFIASLGPKNLGLTGQMADGWLPTWVHIDHLEGMRQIVADGAAAAGRDPKKVVSAPIVVACAGDNAVEMDEATRLLRAHVAYYAGGMGTYYAALFKRYGFGEETERIRAAWTSGDRASAASMVTDEMLRSIAVFGGAEECRERLNEYRRRGADMPVLAFPHRASMEVKMRTLEALAPENVGMGTRGAGG